MSETLLALDIGTEFVKAVIAKTSRKGNLEIIGIGKAKQSPSNMHAGAIANIPAVTEVCEKALYDAEQESHTTANLAIVGIAGELIKGTTTTVRYTRDDSHLPITEEEMMAIIKKVQQKSGEHAKKSIALETGKENVEVRLINSAIVSLTIDGYKISNPVGFKGSDVSIVIYTAFAPLIHVAAIEKVCAELNLDLLAVAVEPFAVCRACLGENDQSTFSGVVMDIGGGTTDIAVVNDGGVEGTKMFSLGGRNFTKQIAESVGIDFDAAEKIKLKLDETAFDEHQQKKIDQALDQTISVWLSGIEIALGEFQDTESLPRNVLLCGGGASLTKVQETLALSDWYKDLPFSRRPVIQLINPDTLPNLVFKTEKILDHSFTTAIGLLRVGMDTLNGAPEEHGIKAKIQKILQK